MEKLNPLSLRASLAADGTSVRAEVSVTLSSIPLLTLRMYPSPPQLPKCHCQPASLPLCPLVNFISLLIMQPSNYSIFVTFSSIHCLSHGSFCETCVSHSIQVTSWRKICVLNCKLNAGDSLSHWSQQLERLPELQNLLLETGSERQTWSTEVAQVTRSRIHPKHHFLLACLAEAGAFPPPKCV